MQKPAKQTIQRWNYRDVIEYIEYKYQIKTRDMGQKYYGKRDKDAPYWDFWHFVINELGEITNGCYLYLPLVAEKYEYNGPPPEWFCEVLGYIKAEFAPDEDEIELWVEW